MHVFEFRKGKEKIERESPDYVRCSVNCRFSQPLLVPEFFAASLEPNFSHIPYLEPSQVASADLSRPEKSVPAATVLQRMML